MYIRVCERILFWLFLWGCGQNVWGPFELGFTGHTENGDSRGGFLPHSTSTVEVNSGDKIVWEIFISVREKVQVREMQESSCLEDHIINLMRWRVNYLVPVAAPVCTLVYYFSGLCIGYISYGSGSYRKVNTGKFTNGVESHHLWICSGKYTSFIIDICVCNQCSL